MLRSPVTVTSGRVEQTRPEWHACDIDTVLVDLETDRQGLSDAVAAARLAAVGPNRLPPAAERLAAGHSRESAPQRRGRPADRGDRPVPHHRRSTRSGCHRHGTADQRGARVRHRVARPARDGGAAAPRGVARAGEAERTARRRSGRGARSRRHRPARRRQPCACRRPAVGGHRSRHRRSGSHRRVVAG